MSKSQSRAESLMKEYRAMLPFPQRLVVKKYSQIQADKANLQAIDDRNDLMSSIHSLGTMLADAAASDDIRLILAVSEDISTLVKTMPRAAN
jgi:hypothetical protein